MKRVLVFGGTAEGRALCEILPAWPLDLTVCVATDYGRQLLDGVSERVAVRTGRMDSEAMEALMRAGFDCVLDATHPYATAVSANIQAAAARAGIPCLRLHRSASKASGTVQFASLEQAVEFLQETEGNILSTTGVKELDAYQALRDYAARVYVRVLPSMVSLERCVALGFPGSRILAMQGPFSQAFNEALIRQWDIRWLVTKDGGDPGGFAAKIEAARHCGIDSLVIGRPPEPEGAALEETLAALRGILTGGA
ncbi:MAG TPA: precorrin-6A reductase, partial [Clostridia bacterium]|nr:precorrin-6A reductase [Clostridia bacterium]